MKKLFSLFIFTVLSFTAFAQTDIHYFDYTYDDAGNRIKREHFIIPQKIAPAPDSSMITPTDGTVAEGTQVYAPDEAPEATPEPEPIIAKAGVHTFKVYPNPTQGALHVEAEDFFIDRENKKASVYDMNGRFITETDIKSNPFNIDFSGYAAGSYILRITATGYKSEFVVVKQ